jgi:uncharacterized protein (DUF2249 family)
MRTIGHHLLKYLLCIPFLLVPESIAAQQVADTAYAPPLSLPAYDSGKGPVVFIDAGHHNFHTRTGRYQAFARLLERDGYQVKDYLGTFEPSKLEAGKILVISNALNELNVSDWYLPNPSAFTEVEIHALKKWVADGGSLFLIADHMPMAGAAADLAAAFEFEFSNGFVFDSIARGPALFDLEQKNLHENAITRGRNSDERVSRIATFTGQAFRIPKSASPILTFRNSYVNFLPDTAWVFTPETRRLNAGGWSQGAYRRFGKGRVVVFGEAAMFTAQLAGPNKFRMGMNNDVAPENYKLLLNCIHWLDGLLD